MRTEMIVGASVLLAALGAGCGGTMDSPAGNAAGMGGAGGTGGSGGAAGSGVVGGQSGGGSMNVSSGLCEVAACLSGHIITESAGSCGGPPLLRHCTPLTPDGMVCVGAGEKCPGEDADAGSASSNDGGAAPSNDGEARSADSGSDAH